MQKKRLLIPIVLILISSFCTATELNDVTLYFTDQYFNPLTDISLYLDAIEINNNTQITSNIFLQESNKYNIKLPNGSWKIKISSISGSPYFSEKIINIYSDQPFTFNLAPSGTIRGNVVDRLDNVVNDATLRFECTSKTQFSHQQTTDEIGLFFVENVPVGDCRISASYKNAVGFITVDIKQGETKDIEIVLDKTIAKPPKPFVKEYFYLAIFVIIGIIIIFLVRILILEKKKKTQEVKSRHSQRIQDIMQTLSQKEKDVINFLLENPAKRTQAYIVNNLGIPRTSISRILESFIKKKIITIEKIGKMKKIMFTDWFMGK